MKINSIPTTQWNRETQFAVQFTRQRHLWIFCSILIWRKKGGIHFTPGFRCFFKSNWLTLYVSEKQPIKNTLSCFQISEGPLHQLNQSVVNIVHFENLFGDLWEDAGKVKHNRKFDTKSFVSNVRSPRHCLNAVYVNRKEFSIYFKNLIFWAIMMIQIIPVLLRSLNTLKFKEDIIRTCLIYI